MRLIVFYQNHSDTVDNRFLSTYPSFVSYRAKFKNCDYPCLILILYSEDKYGDVWFCIESE